MGQFHAEAQPLVAILRLDGHHVRPVDQPPMPAGQESIQESYNFASDDRPQNGSPVLLRHTQKLT